MSFLPINYLLVFAFAFLPISDKFSYLFRFRTDTALCPFYSPVVNFLLLFFVFFYFILCINPIFFIFLPVHCYFIFISSFFLQCNGFSSFHFFFLFPHFVCGRNGVSNSRSPQQTVFEKKCTLSINPDINQTQPQNCFFLSFFTKLLLV
jgi:hypothetical protein